MSFKDRRVGGLTATKLRYARATDYIDNLLDVVKIVKPSVLIGKSFELESKALDFDFQQDCRVNILPKA